MTLGVSVQEIVDKSSNPLLAAHPSWQRVPLGRVARVINGFAFKSAEFNTARAGMPLLRIRDIGHTDTEVYYDGSHDESYVVHRGDLIIGMDGDFNCALWAGRDALLNQRVCKVQVTTGDYDQKFLFYVLPGYLKAINDHTSSVTVKHLSSRTVAEVPLPFPSRAEQERIVSRIDELFSELDAGVAALERVRAGLKRYKASVLSAAVGGQLFKTNRELTIGELPDDWRCLRLGELGTVSGGLTKNPKRKTLPKKMPYLRVANVYANELRLQDVEQIGVRDSEIHRVALATGDLLVVEGNGSLDQIGRVAIWSGEITPCLHQNHIIKVRFDESEVAKFALVYLISVGGRSQIAQVASTTSGLYTLNLSKVSSLTIPLPPPDERRRIVTEVDRRLSLAQQMESAVGAGLLRAARLRRAVLKAAFEGRL
jgi:type I restriction enzyme S subunit